MKKIASRMMSALLAGAMVIGGVALQPALAQSTGETFVVDSVHSNTVFRIKHMGVAYFYGAIWGAEGEYALNFDNPSASSMKISIDPNNVATGAEGRDNHVKNADFFNVEQYPEISFEATSFERVGESEMQIQGNLTMVGQTRPVTVMLEFVGEGETLNQGFKNGFEASFEFKRSEWGMDKYVDVGALGDEVSVYVAIEGKRAE